MWRADLTGIVMKRSRLRVTFALAAAIIVGAGVDWATWACECLGNWAFDVRMSLTEWMAGAMEFLTAARIARELVDVAPVVISGLLVYRLLAGTATKPQSPIETRCRACGHILRGLSEPRCPECGERV